MARKTDLYDLLELYGHLHNNLIPENGEQLNDLWNSILQDKNYYIIIAEEDDKIVSSCTLVIVPNLTHNQKPYALIENVVTDELYRRKGFASACLDYAKLLAIEKGCYKIMLMTGSKKESTLSLYRNAGYNSEDKTAFVQWL